MSKPIAQIAYIGPPGSNGERAASQHLSPPGSRVGTRGLPCRDITDSLRAVADGRARRAIVPWRNALGGSIHEAVDTVLRLGLQIVGAQLLPIRHCLAARGAAPLATVTVVRSHPEALRQCRGVLEARLPQAHKEAATSTSAAAQELGADVAATTTAVLCTPEAAATHGLTVLMDDTADHPENRTLFLVVAPSDTPIEPTDPTVPHLTTVVFATRNEPGALAKVLAVLASANIQMTHIESRPKPEHPWEVRFVAELEGARDTGPVAVALHAMEPHCTDLTILGSWARPESP